MAITVTNLDDDTRYYTTDNEPCDTASISPAANSLVLVSIITANDGGTDVQSVSLSGCGATWTQIAKVQYGFRRYLYLFYAKESSYSTGAITIDHSTSIQSFREMMWSVDEFKNVDASTPYESYVSGNDGGNSDQAYDLTISATSPTGDDIVFSCWGIEGDTESPSMNSELDTVLTNRGGGNDCRTLYVAYDSAPDSSPNPGITWTNNKYHAGIAMIINAGAGGGPAGVEIFRRRIEGY